MGNAAIPEKFFLLHRPLLSATGCADEQVGADRTSRIESRWGVNC